MTDWKGRPAIKSEGRNRRVLFRIGVCVGVTVYLVIIFFFTCADALLTTRFSLAIYRIFGSEEKQVEALRRYYRMSVALPGFSSRLNFIEKRLGRLKGPQARLLGYQIGKNLVHFGMLERAEKLLTRINARFDDQLSRLIHEKRGDIARLEGDGKGARVHYYKAFEAAPPYARSLLKVAEVFFMTDDHKRAIELIQRVKEKSGALSLHEAWAQLLLYENLDPDPDRLMLAISELGEPSTWGYRFKFAQGMEVFIRVNIALAWLALSRQDQALALKCAKRVTSYLERTPGLKNKSSVLGLAYLNLGVAAYEIIAGTEKGGRRIIKGKAKRIRAQFDPLKVKELRFLHYNSTDFIWVVFLYLGLGILLALAFGDLRWGMPAVWVAAILLSLAGEIYQRMLPYRIQDLNDLWACVIGATVGVGSVYLVERLFFRKQGTPPRHNIHSGREQ